VLLASIATFGYLFPLVSTLWAWALPRRLRGAEPVLAALALVALASAALALPLLWLV